MLGVATVAVIGIAGRRLAGPLAGLVAAAIAAVYPNLWINDSLVMSESLALLIVAVALVVALDFDRAPSVGRAVAARRRSSGSARSRAARSPCSPSASPCWRGGGQPAIRGGR